MQFSPSKRIKIDDALAHPVFAKIRDLKKETIASNVIDLPFEKEGELMIPRLRELFLKEISMY